MTRIGQMLLDEGIEKGIQIGREQEAERMRQLIAWLVAQERYDDIRRIADDIDYLNQLINEFDDSTEDSDNSSI